MSVCVGIDVSKEWLGVAFRPTVEKEVVPNDRRGLTRLVRKLVRSKVELVVLEPSGGYERELLERLDQVRSCCGGSQCAEHSGVCTCERSAGED